MANHKTERIASDILKYLSNIILTETNDELLKSITLTEVKVSKDLSYAKVYFTSISEMTHKEIKKEMMEAAPFLRGKLAKVLEVRNIPELPIQIKTGLLPQDIMVPRGLVLPENLAGILGDVHIPLVGSAKSGTFVSRKTAPLPTGKRIVDTKHHNVPSALKDKLFFVNNF